MDTLPADTQSPPLEAMDVVTLWGLFVAFERRLAKELEPMGLTVSTFRLIGEVMQEPAGIRQAELARRLGVRPPSISVAVKRLEERGLLARVPDPADPRARRVVIADPAALGPGLDVLGRMEAVLFGDMGADERAQTRVLMQKLGFRLGVG